MNTHVIIPHRKRSKKRSEFCMLRNRSHMLNHDASHLHQSKVTLREREGNVNASDESLNQCCRQSCEANEKSPSYTWVGGVRSEWRELPCLGKRLHWKIDQTQMEQIFIFHYCILPQRKQNFRCVVVHDHVERMHHLTSKLICPNIPLFASIIKNVVIPSFFTSLCHLVILLSC